MKILAIILNSAVLGLFTLILAAGVIIVPLGLPGTWVIFGDALLYSLIRDFQTSDVKVLLIVGGLALLGEGIEFLSGIVGAKREQVPNGAIIASLIGGIVGAIIGLPVVLIGSVLGLLLGTFLGALIYCLFKTPGVQPAVRMAWATLFSRVIALFAKTAVALGMAVYLLFQIF